MPVGVKVTEIDASLYSNSSYGTPCLAVIGTATKGPVGVPTLCISQKDLKNTFGLQNPNCLGLYAANYFLSEVNRCYYVRVAKDAVASQVIIPGTVDGTPNVENLITLESVSPGTFFDGYTVVISDSTSTDFTLMIKNPIGSVIKSYKNVSLDQTSERYLGNIISDSGVVKVKEFSGSADVKYTVTNGEYKLAGGDNGITGLTSSEYITALNLLTPDTLDIELIATPGVSDPEVILKGIEVAEKRKDSLYFVDPPSGMDYTNVIEWHNGIGEDVTHSSFNTSHGALYWSWQYIYDEISAQEVLVPPSVVVPPVYARSEAKSKPWFAPAGLTRGLLKNVLRSEFVPDSESVDLMYTDPNNINPIITHPTSGLTVFGQKTLWRQPTSLNRVNVRRLVTYIRKIARDVSQYLVFEPNDETTWNSFQDLIEPRLRSIKTNRGLYDYKIVKGEDIVTDEDIDNYRMPAQILIKPTKAAEFIPIDIVISATGTNFNEYNSAYASEI